MSNFIQESLNKTNKYIVLATPLIIFTLITNLYFFVSASGKIINLLIAIFLLFLMTGAFFAGWFNMVKSAVDDDENENPNLIFKNFVPGVGEYFLPALGGIVVSFIVFIIVSAISYFIGMKFIGDPGINPQELKDAMMSATVLKTFLEALTPEQIIKLGYWNILLFFSMNFYYFILLLYFPAIFYKNKNPFIAFFISLKDLFSKKIVEILLIFISIIAIYFLISMLTVLFGGNSIIYFILTLLNFYFITAVVVLIFNFYNNRFIKPLIGQNVDLTI